MSQTSRVKYQIDTYGKVSRNWAINLPYKDKITRLGAVIDKLKKPPFNYKITAGYEHTEHGKDYIYRKQVFNPLPPAFNPHPEPEPDYQEQLTF